MGKNGFLEDVWDGKHFEAIERLRSPRGEYAHKVREKLEELETEARHGGLFEGPGALEPPLSKPENNALPGTSLPNSRGQNVPGSRGMGMTHTSGMGSMGGTGTNFGSTSRTAFLAKNKVEGGNVGEEFVHPSILAGKKPASRK